jgi:FkbM family methyltransferase
VTFQERVRSGATADFLASRISSRNFVRYLPYSIGAAMAATRWRSQLRGGDLSCRVTDQFVCRGSTVVDVGTSWGFFSYHMAGRVGREGRVLSYEPHPLNVPGLRKLSKARPQVTFRQAAISDMQGEATMSVPRMRFRPVTAQASLAHDFHDLDGVETDSVTVPTTRLDDEIGGDTHVAFIKIDVEGHELAVLRGAAATLQRCRPVLLIEIEQRHVREPITVVFDEILSLGYELFCIAETALLPLADFDVNRDQLSHVIPGQFNPFSMPAGYVNDFVAVPSAGMLGDLPVHR